jgi:hypothetical protein
MHPTGGLDALSGGGGELPCPFRESSHDSSVVQPVLKSVHILRYSGSKPHIDKFKQLFSTLYIRRDVTRCLPNFGL